MTLITKQVVKRIYISVLDAYSEPCQTSKMVHFADIVNNLQPFKKVLY